VLNPFKFDIGVSGNFFCDREDTIKELLVHMKNETNLIIFSKRRIGKSSLIKEIFENRLDKDTLSAHIDIYAISNDRELYEYLKKGIEQSFVAKESSLDVLSHLTQKLSDYFSNATVKLSVSTSPIIEITTTQKNYFEAIRDLFDGYFAYLEATGRKAIIAIDEFQKIASLPEGKKIEELLRTIVNKRKNSSFIFAGSNRTSLLPMFNDADRAFYKLGIEYRLSPIDTDVFYSWANERLQRKEMFMERRAFDYLFNESEGETRFMQMIFYKIFDMLESKMIVRVKEAKAILDEFISNRQELSIVLDAYSTNQQNALKLMAYMDGKSIYRKDVLERYGLSKPALQSALKSFISKGIIFENGSSYEFEDAEFKMWLRRI